MLKLLMAPTTGRSARRFFATVKGAVRSVVAPDALVREQAPAVAPDPADVYTPDELPAVEDIEAAAREFDRSADQARRADRGKRAARKILDRLPAGQYGAWLVSRIPSSRQTADLDAIRRIFKQHGLGAVPMKPSAPSLKVERVAVEAPVLAEVA